MVCYIEKSLTFTTSNSTPMAGSGVRISLNMITPSGLKARQGCRESSMRCQESLNGVEIRTCWSILGTPTCIFQPGASTKQVAGRLVLRGQRVAKEGHLKNRKLSGPSFLLLQLWEYACSDPELDS